jgi:hypothetical protein
MLKRNLRGRRQNAKKELRPLYHPFVGWFPISNATFSAYGYPSFLSVASTLLDEL